MMSEEYIPEYILLTLPLDSMGRVTIPSHVRTRLGVRPGDLVEGPDGHLHPPQRSISGLVKFSPQGDHGIYLFCVVS